MEENNLMEKIQNVLNDEESMNQVKQLAQMLTGGEVKDGNIPDFSSLFGNMQSNDTASGAGDDNTGSQGDNTPDFDFTKILKLQEVFSKANKKDNNTELMLALRPLLKPESQQKVDKIIKIFKLMTIWPLLKESGLLGGDLLDFL